MGNATRSERQNARTEDPLTNHTNPVPGHVLIAENPLESLIESFIELMSQVFMLPIFHRRTSC